MQLKMKWLSICCAFFLPSIVVCLPKEMTMKEKVGQLLMVHFHGEEANEDAKCLIQDLGVGGIIYYSWANGLHSPHQVRVLSQGLQSIAQQNRNPIPLFISVDQEGGVVSRFHQGFTSFPGNGALGRTKNLDLAEEIAFAMGEELRSVGANMNLAPVIDVNVNPKNPVIGIRSFGDDPALVAAFGHRMLQGNKRAHVIGVPKHFPGHGDVDTDSHENLPIVRKSMDMLRKIELIPFERLAPEAEAIMTAHILVPALDTKNCATLSKNTIAYLRDVLHFSGVVISDSLVMQGVLKKCQTVEEAAIQAINAGCDLLILGGRQPISFAGTCELTVADMKSIHSALMRAVEEGRITIERLDEAVGRVLALKEKYLYQETPATDVPWAMHQALAKKVAALALQEVHREPLPDLSEKKILMVAPELLREALSQTSFRAGSDVFFFKGLHPSTDEIENARKRMEEADVLCIFSYNAWKSRSQQALIQGLLDRGKPHVLIVVRDPLDAELFPMAKHVWWTFSPTIPSIQAVCEKMYER